ncbi:MAG: helix-turn-helix domain-containing protein [Gammaproteobacteria bacterium]|nr:helix-turn-helix domain-containing protein [Gammaproteobacteria bacterium]
MSTANPNFITVAIELVGLQPLASACGVTYQALRKWEKAGRLPRTEWTGETNYSETIEALTGGRVTKADLLRRSAA